MQERSNGVNVRGTEILAAVGKFADHRGVSASHCGSVRTTNLFLLTVVTFKLQISKSFDLRTLVLR